MKDSARFSGGEARAAVRLITIDAGQAGQRIDNFLLKVCKGVPKSHVYQVLRSGQVRVNKGRIAQTYRLIEGDVVRLPPMRLAEPAQGGAAAPANEFPVLFEDEALLIIDKPAGVAVHGGSGVSHGVIEQLRAARPTLRFLELVHRLDRETSGILMLAKKRRALTAMHEQIRLGKLDKRYLALVKGVVQHSRQHIKLPLFKYTTAEGERRVRVQADGQPSHTVLNLLRKYNEFTLLEAELKTGRTHQIRVHLASSGLPIVGDEKYGDFALNRELQKRDGQRLPLKRMFLHAYRLRLLHPITAAPLMIEASLPTACIDFLQSLEARTTHLTEHP